MKICLVSPVSAAAGGGTAAYIRCLGKRLVESGHEVTGVSRLQINNGRSLAYAESDADSSNEKKVVLDGWHCSLVGPKLALKPLLKKLLPLLTRPGLNHLATWISNKAYSQVLHRTIPMDADIVHYIGTGWELFGFAAAAIATERAMPFTITPFVHPKAWGDSSVDVRFYNQADAVWICSAFERVHLERAGVEPALLHKITMAPADTVRGDGTRFRERHSLGQRPLILFLARKQRYKGFHALRSALSRVIHNIPDVCLVAAGADGADGELPYPPMSEKNYLDLGELTPSRDDAQHKADALAACDVYCMPSTAEAFGIAYIEAWFFGKPVIGGTAPALRELILDEVNGFRVEQQEEQIASRLIQLLTDETLRIKLGETGRRWTEENCTWEAVADQHVTLWNKLKTKASYKP